MAWEMDTPLSQSSVSLKLSEIRRRCEELKDDELNGLRLVDADVPDGSGTNAYNPYDHS
ncbi:MAG: hypothetical protein ACR2QU_00135 [Gammaproteobacteria bacterium]